MTNETIAKEVAKKIIDDIFPGLNQCVGKQYDDFVLRACRILDGTTRSQSSEWIPVETRLRELLNLVFDHEISPGKAEEAIHDLAAGKSIVLPSAPKEKANG